MKNELFLEFQTNIEDSYCVSENTPTGRDVLQHLLTLLAENGALVSPIDPMGFYGWCAKITIDKDRFFLFLQKPDPKEFLLGIEGRRGVFGLFRKPKIDTTEVMGRLVLKMALSEESQ